MSSSSQYILVFAGGAGNRLWPLSRRTLPKQFQRFAGPDSLLQHMVKLCTNVVPIERILVVAVSEFKSIICEQLPSLPQENILIEPSRRDNGPAIALAMLELERRDPNAVAAIVWSDHLIQDAEQFSTTLRTAFSAAANHPDSLVTIGVKPTKPDTGLGYIRIGDEIERGELPVFDVAQFIEKPDLQTATKFITSWQYFVNTGYKVWTTKFFREALEKAHPELTKTIAELKSGNTKVYDEFPKLSIEYLLTQHLDRILMVPANIGWRDMGNWNEYHEVLKESSKSDLVTEGEVYSVNTTNSYVSAKDRPITLVGVKDMIVVDTGDTILIMDKSAAQDIKQLTTLLETDNPTLL